MTTILKLPEEILRKVFQELYSSDLRQCQKTCRSWYFPAHVTLLREMSFWNALEIKKFVTSIDHNPDDSNLKAVKIINIMGVDCSDPQFDKDFVQKLFFRFKNIKEIYALKSLPLFENVTDSENFSAVCPKLETFEITASYKDRTQYYEVVWKLRHCLTLLEIMEKKLLQKYGGTAQFISSLPRLRSIVGLDSFGELLPAFEHLEYLTSIRIKPSQVEKNFAENFLTSKTKAVQDIIVQRLSQVLYLECREQDHFCVESMKFVNKYLTGLETFLFNSYENADWTASQRQSFCNNILDILCSTTKLGHIYMLGIPITDLSKCFPAIINKVFNKDSPGHRILKLELIDDHDPRLANLNIKSDHCQQKVEIDISSELDVRNIISDILDNITTVYNIDEFVLAFETRNGRTKDEEINSDTYDSILGKMPSLKQVTMDIPLLFNQWNTTSTNTYPLVETLTLRSTQGKSMNEFLKRCSCAYPNLKQLNLPYYSGDWDEDVGESQVGLQGFALDKLMLDITHMLRMKDFRDTTTDFFVVVVETNDDELYMYKVSFDLSFSSITDEDDLGVLTPGEDYVQLYITIDSLKYLEVCALISYDYDRDEVTIDNYLDFPKFTNRIGFTLDNNC